MKISPLFKYLLLFPMMLGSNSCGKKKLNNPPSEPTPYIPPEKVIGNSDQKNDVMEMNMAST